MRHVYLVLDFTVRRDWDRRKPCICYILRPMHIRQTRNTPSNCDIPICQHLQTDQSKKIQ